MPSQLRPAARLSLVVLAFALAVCWPALAGPPGGIEVTIERPDGTSRSVLASQADTDITGPYTVRQANGTTTQVEVEDGASIYELLVAAGDSQLGYGTLEIPRPSGGVVKLTREQIDAAVPRPPVLYSDESGATWFLRSPSSSTDVNAADHFKIPTATLAIKQIAGELTVKVEASRKKIDPGESVRFTASVSGGPSDVSHVFNWVFDDGKKADDGGSSISHRFAEAGTYNVVVGVRIDGETRSDSASVRIQVGEPKESDKDREGGGENGAADAPDSGSSTGTTGGSDGSVSAPVLPPPSTLTPAPVTPVPPTPSPSGDSPEPPDIATSGTTVEGNLLADVSDPPPSNILESAARAAREGNPKDDGPDGAGVSEAALSIAGVLALLGLGAGIETRQGRLPRLRLPRRAA